MQKSCWYLEQYATVNVSRLLRHRKNWIISWQYLSWLNITILEMLAPLSNWASDGMLVKHKVLHPCLHSPSVIRSSSCPQILDVAYESAEMYVTVDRQTVSHLPENRPIQARHADRRAMVSEDLKGEITHHCCPSQTHRRSYASSCRPRTPSCPRARCSCSHRRTGAHLCCVSVLEYGWSERGKEYFPFPLLERQVNAYPCRQRQSSA